MMEPRRTSNTRVEKKGRFTITEIIPGSPNSARLMSPTFHDDDVSVSDAAFEDAEDDLDDGALQSRQAAVVNSSEGEPLLAVGVAQDKHVEAERPESPTEAVAVAVAAPVAPCGNLAAATMAEAAINPSSEAPVAAVAANVAATAAATLEPVSKESSPEKVSEESTSTSTSTSAPGTPPMRPSSRRVKRKGRFTIIELASDSPTSRKTADDLYDHRFMTTTSIASNAEAPAQKKEPANPTRYSRSYSGSRRGKPKSKPQRAVRSMTRYRQPGTTRKSRRRSESPVRELLEPIDMVDPSGNQQQQQEAAAAAAAYAGSEEPYSEASVAASPVSVAPSSSPMPTTSSMPDTGSVSTSSATPVTPLQQLVQVPEAGAMPQTAITISATQFLQQQQTIASLIRQQHDLKQIIGVLQEQQQQLMTIPMQINELKRENANANSSMHVNNAEAKDEETRELYVQVETLMRANDSLQSLLNAAEQDARHRSLEVECLSEENDELRHRCALLESRYLDERKQTFILEDELQRFRKLVLVQHDQQQSQQHSQQQPQQQPQQADDKAVPLE